MKQHDAVIQALEELGGQSTLADLYVETMKIKNCDWKTKTPFASIRRIVQTRPEIFRIRPGLWALRSYQKKLGLIEDTGQTQEAGGKAGSSPSEWHEAHPAVLIRIVSGTEYDTAWSNLWSAYSGR